MTNFLDKHPGGREALASYKGKRIDNVLFNDMVHKHGNSALKKMEAYKIGIIDANANSNNKTNNNTTNTNIKTKSPP